MEPTERTKASVLFVDDEENVVKSMQRQLRKKCRDWDLYFALSADEAIQIVNDNKIDALVTDANMPYQSGELLLQKVVESNPEMIRIMLSGNANSEAMLKSLLVAHQFISKPYDADTIVVNINRILRLRNNINNIDVLSKISSSNSLPVLPGNYQEVTSALNNPDVSLTKVAQLIEKDIGMLTKILQIVNSSFFGLSRKIVNLNEAVSFLGIETIRSIFMTNSMFNCCDIKLSKKFSLENTFSHSMKVGQMAAIIASEESDDTSIINYARLAGFMHEMGLVVLAYSATEQLIEIQKTHDLHSYIRIKNWVGAYILQLWSLPFSIIETVAYLDKPSEFLSDDEQKSFSTLSAVHIAHALLSEHTNTPLDTIEMDDDYLTKLNIIEKIPKYLDLCREFL